VFALPDKARSISLICSPAKKCESCFECNDAKAIRCLVLSLIGLNLTLSGKDILHFFKQTLFYKQQKKRFHDQLQRELKEEKNAGLRREKGNNLVPAEFALIAHALKFLLKNKFISGLNSDQTSIDWTDDSDNEVTAEFESLFYLSPKLEATRLGRAAIKGNIDLDCVHQLYADLEQGLRSICLSNSLHLLFLCTPYDLVNSLVQVDYEVYCQKPKTKSNVLVS
jgi:POLQ-like helicase